MAANPKKTPRAKRLLPWVFEPSVWEQEPTPRHFKQCMRVFPWRVKKKKNEHQESSSAYCWKDRSAELSGFMALRHGIARLGLPDLSFEGAVLESPVPSLSAMAEYDESGYTALHYAAAEGDVWTAAHLLECAESLAVDQPLGEERSETPDLRPELDPDPDYLFYAPRLRALYTPLQIPQLNDSDVGLVMSNATPLHIASFFGQEEMVEFLLKKGANPNACVRLNKDGEHAAWVGDVTALYLAIQEEHISVVKLLIQHGASIFNEVPFSRKASLLTDLLQWMIGQPGHNMIKWMQNVTTSRQCYSSASSKVFLPTIAVMQPPILQEILAMPEVIEQLKSLPPGVKDFISDCMVAFAASKCKHELRDSYSRPPFDCELVAQPGQHLLGNSRVSSPVKMLGDLLVVMANFNMISLANLCRLLTNTVLYKRSATQVYGNSWHVPANSFQGFFQGWLPGRMTSAGVNQETIFSAKTCIDIIRLLMSFGIVPQRDLQRHLSPSSLSTEAKMQNNLLLYQTVSRYNQLCVTTTLESAAPYLHMIQILLDLGWTTAGWNASQGIFVMPLDAKNEGSQDSFVPMDSIYPNQEVVSILCATDNPMSLTYAAQSSILRSIVNPANISKLPLPNVVKESLRAYPHGENPFE